MLRAEPELDTLQLAACKQLGSAEAQQRRCRFFTGFYNWDFMDFWISELTEAYVDRRFCLLPCSHVPCSHGSHVPVP